MQQLITIILFVVAGIRLQLCFGHRATYVHPPVPGLPPPVDGTPPTTTKTTPMPFHEGPHYLDSYLPPVMQACAYFIELLQYEPIGMTTIEPPFEGNEAEGGTTYTPPKKPSSTTAKPWWQTTTTAMSTTKKPSTVWWVPPTTTPKPAETTKPPGTTWWPTTTFPPETTTKKSSTIWWSKPADAPKPTTTKPSYTTKPPGTTWWPTTTFPPGTTTKKSSTVWWSKPADAPKPTTTKPIKTTTKKYSTIWWQPPSTTKKPVTTTPWWQTTSTTKKPIVTTQWWQTTKKPVHDSSAATTLKPPSLPRPTPYHRPGYYAPMPYMSRPNNRVPYIGTTTRKPFITSTTEKQREEIILGTLNSDNNFFDWLFQEKAKTIQPSTEYDFQRLDPLPGSLIHDILYEPYELPALRDKDNINEFLRVYDDSYGRYHPISGKKRIPPTKPYVELLMLYDLLKREAKAMNLNKYEGYSDKFMKELAETSKRSSERQLHTMFTRLLARGEVERSTIVTRIESIIKDLENPNSVTSKSLRLIPPLQFVP